MKKFIKKIICAFGYSIVKKNNFYYGLKKFDFEIILDIGANNDESSGNFLKIFKRANIYAFEPNNNHLTRLEALKKISKGRFNYYISGVGSRSGSASLKVHINHDASSSFLNLSVVGAKALQSFTKMNLEDQGIMNSKIITLNEFFKDIDYKNKRILLKSDTQGYEMEVLRGAENIIEHISVVQIELDFINFYNNQSSAEDIIFFLYQKNFSLRGFTYPPGLNEFGEILSSDFIFYNNRINFGL
ncbi:FkbM family methyltransferase [Polynucleobacter paneuropaeus]|nr:FkbM family methyltransferase [Polynucleobacter paneuropaeus]MBT8599717.1 FkbM family methyltransferase [Polynucleobacter paneuropaeus]